MAKSNIIKEAVENYENSTALIQEQTKEAFKDILKQKIEEYCNDENETKIEETDNMKEDEDSEEIVDTIENEPEDNEDTVTDTVTELPVKDQEDGNTDEWAEFNEYKVDGTDDEYNFDDNTPDEILLRVLKVMNDDDVIIKQDADDSIELTVDEPGTFKIEKIEGSTEIPSEDDNEDAVIEIDFDDEPEETDNEGLDDTEIDENGTRTLRNLKSASVKPETAVTASLNTRTTGVRVGSMLKTESIEKQRQLVRENKILKLQNESLLKENKFMTKFLDKVNKSLSESTVINSNMGQIIKILSENSTSRQEKIEIINRFGNEAKTIEESKKLYKVISENLKSKKVGNTITEKIDKKYVEDKKVIAESTQEKNYTNQQSKVIDLMKKINK